MLMVARRYLVNCHRNQCQWSVSISGNWRVIFEFEGQHVTNVDLVDYH
jgi:plasmid maintenance system killer protein